MSDAILSWLGILLMALGVHAEDKGTSTPEAVSVDSTVVRGLVVPLPEDAKVETDYFENVSIPFYTRWLVDSYHPDDDVAPDVAERVRAVRRAYARALATSRSEFPTQSEFEMAHRLWREGCRDAAVAIVHYNGLNNDDRFWKSEQLFNEALDEFDDDDNPVLGYLLRQRAMNAAYYRIGKDKKRPRQPAVDAEAAWSNSFFRVAEILKNADRRIAERLDVDWCLPKGAAELLGNEYLACCQRARTCMDKAFNERGSGWAKDLTDEQIRGWRNYNDEARSCLEKAIALRPEDSRALMMLASLNARSCGADDPVALMNRAVSNSLDFAAESIGSVFHYQTSRWGGSTEFLLDAIRAATTNVCTRSTFSYRAAATALKKIFTAETGEIANTNLANAVLTPELTDRLYKMFDAYIAEPESPYMPSRDVFVGMAVSLALQKRDWPMVRKYVAMLEKPLTGWRDAWWIRLASHSSDSKYLSNMFEILGRKTERGELFIDAEIALSEERFADADAIYRKLQGMGGLSEAEKRIANRQGFRVRKMVQEAEGGWVDVMPTTSANESMSWWGLAVTSPDGRARVANGGKSYYRLELALPGRGAEYEATVHFETRDEKQTEWFIGWGLARPYTGFCVNTSSWAFPYIGFRRDGTGDYVVVECPTADNVNRPDPDPKPKYGQEQGLYPKWDVYESALERSDSHSFRLRWDEARLTISVDDREVWSIPTSTALSVYDFNSLIQSDGSVLPVWKVFKNTAFSGYRYRLL